MSTVSSLLASPFCPSYVSSYDIKQAERQELLYRSIKPEDVKAEAEYVIEYLARSPINLFTSITWSMPSVGTIDSMIKHTRLKGIPRILDVGCGRGYISWRLQQEGVETLPIDHTPSLEIKWKLGGEPFVDAQKFDREDEILDVVRRNARNSALLLSWPPFHSSMGANTLKAFREGGGKVCFVMGPGIGGCVGTDEMWTILYNEWNRENSPEDGSTPLQVRDEISDKFFVCYAKEHCEEHSTEDCKEHWLEWSKEDRLDSSKEHWLDSSDEDGSSLGKLFA